MQVGDQALAKRGWICNGEGGLLVVNAHKHPRDDQLALPGHPIDTMSGSIVGVRHPATSTHAGGRQQHDACKSAVLSVFISCRRHAGDAVPTRLAGCPHDEGCRNTGAGERMPAAPGSGSRRARPRPRGPPGRPSCARAPPRASCCSTPPAVRQVPQPLGPATTQLHCQTGRRDLHATPLSNVHIMCSSNADPAVQHHERSSFYPVVCQGTPDQAPAGSAATS